MAKVKLVGAARYVSSKTQGRVVLFGQTIECSDDDAAYLVGVIQGGVALFERTTEVVQFSTVDVKVPTAEVIGVGYDINNRQLTVPGGGDLPPVLPIGGNPLNWFDNTWVRLPDARLYPGLTLFCRDLGVAGKEVTSNGLRWNITSPLILSSNPYAMDDCTDANTNEIVVHRCIIPPFLMHDRYALLVSAKVEWPGSTTLKTVRVMLGSTQVALVTNGSSGTVLGTRWEGMRVGNANSTLAQVGEAGGSAGVWAQQSTPFQTSSVNTQIYVEASIRAAWGAAGSGSNKIIVRDASFTLTPG